MANQLNFSKAIRVAGWSRVIFGALASIGIFVKDVGLLNPTDHSVAPLSLVFDVAFGLFGVAFGVALLQIASNVEARRGFSVCILGLLTCGILTPCDCGWAISTPITLIGIPYLFTIRSEFSGAAIRA